MPFEAIEKIYGKFFKYFIVMFVLYSSGALFNTGINDWQAITLDSLYYFFDSFIINWIDGCGYNLLLNDNIKP